MCVYTHIQPLLWKDMSMFSESDEMHIFFWGGFSGVLIVTRLVRIFQNQPHFFCPLASAEYFFLNESSPQSQFSTMTKYKINFHCRLSSVTMSVSQLFSTVPLVIVLMILYISFDSLVMPSLECQSMWSRAAKIQC